MRFGIAPKKHDGGYRHFPATGPAGETCSSCGASYTKKYNRDTYWLCHALTKLKGSPGKPINIDTAACKYWMVRGRTDG